MNNRWLRNTLFYVLIIGIVTTGIIYFLNRNSTEVQEIPLSQVIILARDNPEDAPPIKIVSKGDDINITAFADTEQEQNYTAQRGDGSDLFQILNDAQIPETSYEYFAPPSGGIGRFFTIILTVLPLLLLFAIIFFIFRQAQGGSNQAFGFGRSKAKVFIGSKANVTFADVAGAPEAKEELQEVVEFLKYPERFRKLGARVPKGVLLVGPPGTGKTLLARAVAGEAGAPFFSISGSEFVEMFVGVGASRVRDLFEKAKRHSPAIIFMDEIDAVGRHRGSGLGGGHDEREQTLNQILVEMDGFDTGTNVIIIAATNRPDILDPALLRPGRFDRRVLLDRPDINGRRAIMAVHSKGMPFKDVDWKSIARQTPGFSGADLANLINEAALLAGRTDKNSIGTVELTEAIDRVSVGPARKSRVISKEEREMIAYHEAGHAIVSHFSPEGDSVGKISIISRGHAGGFTRYQHEDKSLLIQTELEAQIASAMGGRVAEFMKFGKVSTGASSDIEQATKIARNMVTRFGMSTELGPRLLGKKEEAIFLGKEMSEQRDYSLRTEIVIDREIDRLLQEGKQRAEDILTEHAKELDSLAEYLLLHETVEENEFVQIMAGISPSKPEDENEQNQQEPVEEQTPKQSIPPIAVTEPKPLLP